MRVVTSTGETIELGTIETAPTIGITDYSRRVTDDYGVTTVVERGFSRRMSVRLAVPFDDVDALQRRLAELRATPATWIADDRFASLTVTGFYKEFEVDHAVPPLSYCTLSVEGLAETTSIADVGGEPAVSGVSTLQLLQPAVIDEAHLVASNVAEADAAAWSASVTYPTGARVILAATHRIYESLVDGNVGADPAGASGNWLDVAPTNRWAMFDQALGSATSAAGSVTVTIEIGSIEAVALLDVVGATVRVQAGSFDRTAAAGAGAVTFLGLPVGTSRVSVTIAGPETVSVGTLLVGRLVGLGVTEGSPTSGITDYSRKVTDDFGGVTVVPRAFAKRMSAKALIRSDAVDLIAARIAAVRARPALWLGQDGIDSLIVYGFFKDFSIEIGEGVSKLALSIEGLSAAGKIAPLGASVNWPDIADPTGTKPTDNADKTSDNTAKDTDAVGGTPASEVLSGLAKIEPIVLDLANLDKAVDAANTALDGLIDSAVRTDDAIGALVRVDTEHDEALQALRETNVATDAALVALAGAGADLDAARRQMVRDTGRLEETLMRAVLESERTRTVLRDAGIVVDPADGSVRIYAVDQLRDRTSTAEAKINAQTASIGLKASVDYVQEQIALAVLDPSQVAELEPIIKRLTQAELDIDGLNASISLKAEATELTAVSGKVTTVGQDLDALTGEVALRATTTTVDAIDTRTGLIEQKFQALPDVTTFSFTMRQARAVADDAAAATLAGILAADTAGKRQIVQIAELREDAYTRIDAGLAAESLARRTLSAAMAGNDARVVEQLRALTTEDKAQAERIEALSATSEGQTAAIARLDEAAIDAAGGVAGTRVTIRQQAADAGETAEAMLRALIAGDESAQAARRQLVQVQEESTTRLVAGELSAASTRRLLEARIGSAEAFAASSLSILTQADRATGERLDALSVSFGKDLAAATASVSDLTKATADADKAQVEATERIATQINDPETGLSQTRAELAEETRVSAERDEARIEDIKALGLTVGEQALAITHLDEAAINAAGGIAGTSLRVRQIAGQADDADEALLRALIAGDDANRGRLRQVTDIASEFTTTLVANEAASAVARQSLVARMNQAEASLFDISRTLATKTESLVQRIAAGEAVFADPDTGLKATRARLIEEERLRGNGEKANAEATKVLSAQVNDPKTGLPAAFTEIARVEKASADQGTALTEVTDQISAQVNDPKSGLPFAISEIARVEKASVDQGTALTEVTDQISAQVNDPKSGLPFAISEIARVEKASADQSSALTEVTDQISADLNDPETGLPAARAAIATNLKAQVDADKAVTTAVEAIRAVIDGVGSVGLQEAFEAVLDRLGTIEGRYTVSIDVNGNLSGFQLIGGATGPASFNLINTDLKMGTGRIIYDTGKFMEVQGVAFGVARDLVEWFGPTMDVAKCSRANAISYKSIDGDAYFGGSLSAGILRNASSSSGLSVSELAQVGPFGSNGRPIRYVASWSYRTTSRASYPATNEGLRQYNAAAAAANAPSDGSGGNYGTKTTEQANSTVVLTRALAGSDFVQLDQRGFTTQTTTFSGQAPTTGDAPGHADITSTIGGGFTVNDPVQSASDRTVKLTLARGFSASGDTVSQRLSIVATEE